MSDYHQYLKEKEDIDLLIQRGYQINRVQEHLDGATVEFIHTNMKEIQHVLIGTANARKYFSSLIAKKTKNTKGG